jgi:hypothetical protein
MIIYLCSTSLQNMHKVKFSFVESLQDYKTYQSHKYIWRLWTILVCIYKAIVEEKIVLFVQFVLMMLHLLD